MSQAVVHLRPEEREVFEGLSDELKDGWQVEEETLNANERPEELEMRYRMASLSDEACKKFCESAKEAKSTEEILKAAEQFDMSALPQHEAAELFFTLGTKVLSAMILYLLQNTNADEDMEGVAGLTEIRHMLFESNASIA
jgi:hypothetical protein